MEYADPATLWAQQHAGAGVQRRKLDLNARTAALQGAQGALPPTDDGGMAASMAGTAADEAQQSSRHPVPAALPAGATLPSLPAPTHMPDPIGGRYAQGSVECGRLVRVCARLYTAAVVRGWDHRRL